MHPHLYGWYLRWLLRRRRTPWRASTDVIDKTDALPYMALDISVLTLALVDATSGWVGS